MRPEAIFRAPLVPNAAPLSWANASGQGPGAGGAAQAPTLLEAPFFGLAPARRWTGTSSMAGSQ